MSDLRNLNEMFREVNRRNNMLREIERAMELAKPQLTAVEAALKDFTDGPVARALRDINRLRF